MTNQNGTNKRANDRKPFVRNQKGGQKQNKAPPKPEQNNPYAGAATSKRSRKRKAAGKGVPLRTRDSDEDASSESDLSAGEYAYLATHGPPGDFPKLTTSSGGVTRVGSQSIRITPTWIVRETTRLCFKR